MACWLRRFSIERWHPPGVSEGVGCNGTGTPGDRANNQPRVPLRRSIIPLSWSGGCSHPKILQPTTSRTHFSVCESWRSEARAKQKTMSSRTECDPARASLARAPPPPHTRSTLRLPHFFFPTHHTARRFTSRQNLHTSLTKPA